MLKQFSARGFRNLQPFDWEPGERHNLLLGPNGAGKTSVLEALYTLATTRSFRTARLVHCLQHGEQELDLGGEVVGEARSQLSLSWSEQGLERAVNGATVSWSDHLEVLPVVLWWSGLLETLVGSPRLRRRMLDQGVVGLHPAALAATARFRQALRQKRELLARGSRGLTSWNEVFAQAACEVTRLRARYTEILAVELRSLLEARGEASDLIALRYEPSLEAALDGSDEAFQALERSRDLELDQRQALLGPHRDELAITWRGHPVSEEASAGERKWIGLALAAARGRVLESQGRKPLYLLDDLDAELDAGRLERSLNLFPGTGQIVATSSRPEAWRRRSEMRVGRLSKGRIDA